jgi:hypothetical protein
VSLFYGLAYRLGITPWEEAQGHPPAARAIVRPLRPRQEGQEPSYGQVLDLGCGNGYWAVELAGRAL